MAETIYCHQCAQGNTFPRKFCLKCSSPLLLRGDAADTPHICRTCNHANPSFARFCTQCSHSLIANPSKSPDPRLPVVLRNIRAVGSDLCPACSREAPTVVSDYVRDIKSENRSKEIRDNAGFVHGTVGGRIRIENGLKEPRSGLPTGLPQTLFTGGLGCVLTLLLPAIILTILPMLRASGVLLWVIAMPIGFFLAHRSYRRLLKPYLDQLETARARWRRAHICLRYDAVFIPKEGVYTAPAHLERLVWDSPKNT